MSNQILLVDDDIDILSGFQRNLRKDFRIQTAASGREALDIINTSPQFAVIVSDYSMPGMNGIELLAAIRRIFPDTVRMILTGYADLETSIKAVNEGHIFRFLTKPVSPETLIASLKDALEYYRLTTLEKELLDKTLKGSIKILIDILSVVNPVAFSQTTVIRKIARAIADKLGMKNSWEVEIAALLSKIGCVAVPSDIIEKKSKGDSLSPNEMKIYEKHPVIGRNLLKNIPRFDQIAEAILFQNRNFDGSDSASNLVKGEDIPLIARILKVANDYNTFLNSGMSSNRAIESMIQQSSIYDPQVLEALSNEQGISYSGYVIKNIPFKKLRLGMVLADDIRDDRDYVLISKGHEITDVQMMRLINISKFREIIEPIKVYDIEQV
jgi:response regulator RpfG family c-di-GMP phosphodiesterase